MSSAEPTMNIPVPPVDPRRLLVRRALGPDARSREDFLWPFFGPVEMFQPETFNDNPQDCGPGLYGNSCAPSVAERQNYVWKGNFWRLWLAESDPVICPDGKAKAPRGFVLAAGSCYHIAREVVRYGGELPTTLRKELRQRTSPFLAFTHTPEEYQAALLLAEQKDLEQEGQERVRVGLARLGRAVATWGALGSGYPLSAGDPPPQYDRLKRWADSKALLPDVDSQFILKLLEVSTLDAVNLKRAFDLSYVTTDKAAARPQVTPDSVYAIRDVEEWVVTRVPYGVDVVLTLGRYTEGSSPPLVGTRVSINVTPRGVTGEFTRFCAPSPGDSVDLPASVLDAFSILHEEVARWWEQHAADIARERAEREANDAAVLGGTQ